MSDSLLQRALQQEAAELGNTPDCSQAGWEMSEVVVKGGREACPVTSKKLLPSFHCKSAAFINYHFILPNDELDH